VTVNKVGFDMTASAVSVIRRERASFSSQKLAGNAVSRVSQRDGHIPSTSMVRRPCG
jgi:hypothetical protein